MKSVRADWLSDLVCVWWRKERGKRYLLRNRNYRKKTIEISEGLGPGTETHRFFS